MRRRITVLSLGLILLSVVLSAQSRTPSADDTAAPTIVYVVRHAEKASDAPDADLSSSGRIRAQVLTWMMRDIELQAVYSTNVSRTMNTVSPVAKAKGLNITHYQARPSKLAAIIRNEHIGKSVLICGHSNTIPGFLSELGCPIEETVLGGFDDLFVVILTRDSAGEIKAVLQRLHYPAKR